VLAISIALLCTTSACVMSPRSVHTIGHLAGAALWTAAIVGSVTLLSYHDEHYHYGGCGHYRRWHDDRWVYYYGDQWEYYDEPSSSWYVYAEL
jgi:hypothetical protein